MNDAWPTRKLREIAEIRISNVDKKVYANEKPVKLCNYMDVYGNEYVSNRIQFMEGSATAAEIERFGLKSGDVVITNDSETPDDIGIPAVVLDQITNLVCGYHLALIRPNAEQFDPIYLAKQLSTSRVARYFSLHASGSTRYGLPVSAIEAVEIPTPPKPEQAKIAEILSTVDRAIEQTEALIAKQQRIKTGLMQDLLTRGIDEHGNLRSEQTHEFKDSLLGRIPVEWEVTEFGQTIESAVDGPFGSNLKSDHYVAEAGVRVIRLGNIGNGKFLDQDKAWISNGHGRQLFRHAVQPMDLLIASLGDERHPFGRACIFKDNVSEAIVKADVFRVRCKGDRLVHSFAVQLFNFPRWRQGLFALAQGVTRDRVNLTNIRLLQLPIPSIPEQKAIARNIDSIDEILAKFGTAVIQNPLDQSRPPARPAHGQEESHRHAE